MFKEVATGIKIEVGDLFFIANVKIFFLFIMYYYFLNNFLVLKLLRRSVIKENEPQELLKEIFIPF